jgi:hypothetical protein
MWILMAIAAVAATALAFCFSVSREFGPLTEEERAYLFSEDPDAGQ